METSQIQELEKLVGMKEKGHLTESEFEVAKSSILSQRISTDNHLNATGDIALWNPTWIANWSLFLTPVFSSWLNYRNWIALGEKSRANHSLIWFAASLVVVGVSLMGKWPQGTNVAAVNFLTLLAWYFTSGNRQMRFVRDKYRQSYKRKSFVLPIIGYLVIFFFVASYLLLTFY